MSSLVTFTKVYLGGEIKLKKLSRPSYRISVLVHQSLLLQYLEGVSGAFIGAIRQHGAEKVLQNLASH